MLDKEEIGQELELLHCLEGVQKCCRGKKVALEIAIIRMSMEDIISIIYVNNRREKKMGPNSNCVKI